MIRLDEMSQEEAANKMFSKELSYYYLSDGSTVWYAFLPSELKYLFESGHAHSNFIVLNSQYKEEIGLADFLVSHCEEKPVPCNKKYTHPKSYSEIKSMIEGYSHLEKDFQKLCPNSPAFVDITNPLDNLDSKPKHLSTVLISTENYVFVVTAGHVLANLNDALQVNNFVALPYTRQYLLKKPDNLWCLHHDFYDNEGRVDENGKKYPRLDVGYLVYNKEDYLFTYPHHKPIGVERVKIHTQLKPDHLYMVCGWPGSELYYSGFNEPVDKEFRASFCAYVTNPVPLPKAQELYPSYNEDIDIVLRRIGAAPLPGGMSGGGIWDFGQYSRENNYNSDNALLVGIQSATHDKNSLFLGISIIHLLRLMYKLGVHDSYSEIREEIARIKGFRL